MKKKYICTITFNLEVEIDEVATTLTDFITELDYAFRSQTDGAVILNEHWIDYDYREVKG